MTMKGRLALAGIAVVVVAAVVVSFVTRTPWAESPPMAAVEPPAAVVERVDAPVLPALQLPARSAEVESLVVEEAPTDVPAIAGGNVLRVVLEGITEDDAPLTTVTLTGVDEHEEWPAEIRDSWSCQGLASEFDLEPFFASVAEREVELRIDALAVQVDSPLHLIERVRVPLTGGVELASGRVVYEARVLLVPAAVIHGSLAREGGVPASEGMVGALLLEDDFPIEAEGRAVECAEDGEFELRVPASGRYALTSYEEGRRPTTTRVEALVGTRVDVGTLLLESGDAITGHVLRQGRPLEGATVSATPPTHKTAAAPGDIAGGMHASVYEGRAFATPVRSVHLLWLPPNFASGATEPGLGSRRNGRFELASQRVSTDDSGAFAFRGLGAGEYLVRMRGHTEVHDTLPGYWDHTDAEWMYHIHGDLPARIVAAPDHGVALEYYWTWVRFELRGDLESGDEGRLLLKTPSGHSTADDEDLPPVDPRARNLSIAPEFYTRELQLSGNEPTHVLHAPPDKHITGEVRFPDRQPVLLDFRTPKPGGELEVPVVLAPLEEPATLVIKLEHPQSELPEAFLVKLWRAGNDELPPDARPVAVAEGQLQVEDIFPGEYRVRVRAGRDDRSAGLFHEYEFELELQPGVAATRSILMPKGAGLRFTVRGEDGKLLGGEYEFSDDLGYPVDLNTHVLEDKGWASSWKIFPHGTHESFNELHPGTYQLVLRSPGHAERSLTLDLRAGEWEDLEVSLSK